MRGTTMMIAAGALIATATPVAAPAQGQLPPGTWANRCTDARMRANVLQARCQDRDGRYQWTSIDLRNGCRGNLTVDRQGQLTCVRDNDRPGGPVGGAGNARRGPITLWGEPGFRGRSVIVRDDIPDLRSLRFNEVAESIWFERNSGTWQVCTRVYYAGNCQVIDTSVRNLESLGLRKKITSVRRWRDGRPR